MENTTVAVVQPRFCVVGSHDEFASLSRRWVRQAQAKGAELTVFPELTGLMLAPLLASRLRRGLVTRTDRGRRPDARFLARQVGRVAAATAGVLGGGLAANLPRLVAEHSSELRDACLETFSQLAREHSTAIAAGSLYVLDSDTGTVRNRAYLLDAGGNLLGFQDKLNLAPSERGWVAPGHALSSFDLRFGRLGLLIGQDVLLPELARGLAVRGVDLIAGMGATSYPGQAVLMRSALALRAEENHIYCAASFLVGPDHLGPHAEQEYTGQSALLVPGALSRRGDGVLLQAGSNRAEGLIAALLPARDMLNLRRDGWFRPRAEMNLGESGSLLASLYAQGLTIEEAIRERPTDQMPQPPEERGQPAQEPSGHVA